MPGPEMTWLGAGGLCAFVGRGRSRRGPGVGRGGVIHLADNRGDGFEAGCAGRMQPSLTGNQLISAALERAHEDRLQDAHLPNGRDQWLQRARVGRGHIVPARGVELHQPKWQEADGHAPRVGQEVLDSGRQGAAILGESLRGSRPEGGPSGAHLRACADRCQSETNLNSSVHRQAGDDPSD